MYPRDVAARVLTRVLSGHETLDVALLGASREVHEEHQAWLQEVSSGTLRWKARLDLVIDSIALKKKPSGWLRKILLLAVYQLVVQERIQPSAVVNETVSEIKEREGAAPANFANALLRKVADTAESWRDLQFPANGTHAEKAMWASLPEWLWTKLFFQYGEDWARAYALASLERPSLWVRAKEAKWNPEWAEKGPIEKSWRSSERGAVQKKTGFAEGAFIVQDISNQILVHEVTEVAKRSFKEEIKGEIRALDLCAAPGGKAIGMDWNGMRVTATDLEGARVRLLEENVARLSPDVEVINRSQVGALPQQDLVWVDAPCSGTGILRRHPDARWLKAERDLVSLNEIQTALISEARMKLRPGGLLVYSVCSVLKDEGASLIKKLGLKPEHEWFLEPQRAPHGDGFWCALIRNEPHG